MAGNFLELIELFGIKKERLIRINKLTQFKKVIIPEPSVIVADDSDKMMWKNKENYCYYTKEYKQIFEKIKSAIEPLGDEYKKVFYSRQNFDKAKSRDLGEHKEIQDFFESLGYKIISPEKLSVKEQIGIMKSCKNFVTFSGTLAHNLIFAEPETNAIILNKSYQINPHQPLIDEVSGIIPLYIDTHLSILPIHIGWGPFYISVSKNLINWANDNGYNIKNYFSYKYFKEFLQEYFKNAPESNRLFHIITQKRHFFDFYLKQIDINLTIKFLIKLTHFCPFILRFLYYFKKFRRIILVLKNKIWLMF